MNQAKVKNFVKWVNKTLDKSRSISRNGEISVNCPFCENRGKSKDIKHHLYISTYEEVAHCFRCGWAGNWIKLIIAVENCSYTEAVIITNGIPTLEAYKDYIESLKPKKPTAEQMLMQPDYSEFAKIKPLTKTDSFLEKKIYDYLVKRNIPERFIFSGIFGIMEGMLRVYIISADNYWQGRAIINAVQPKYLNPNIKVDSTLGFYDSSNPVLKKMFDNSNCIFITEGVFSALALMAKGQAALCLYGKEAREEQVHRLVAIKKPLVVMLDADASINVVTSDGEIKNYAWDLAIKLHHAKGEEVRVAVLSKGDPETCNKYSMYVANEYNNLRRKI